MSQFDVSALGGSYRDPVHSTSRIQLRRAVTLVAMTLAAPGSAQLVQGNRPVGRIAMRVWLATVTALVALALMAFAFRSTFLSLATNPQLLTLGRWLLIALAIGWALLIVDAWRLGRPKEQTRGHRAVSTVIGSTAVVLTAGMMLFAAHTVSVVNGFSDAVFVSTTVSDAHDGRYNVVLFGSDSGTDRDGMRPDSINVASIDADTGRAVLIGLPRNLENVPFPKGSVMRKEFPRGFTCEGCYLNAVNTWADDHADLFDKKNPGLDVTMGTIEEITGLKMNYYALVNMKGFSTLIDSVGGVNINVRERTAIGGIGSPIRGWIEAGDRTLTGDEALWYARSRVMNDDWSRMGRQKCVMNAMVKQLIPQKVLLNMQDIANSGSAMLSTSIPRQDMGVFMDLALKTKNEPISSVSLVPPAVYTGNPDYPKVRRLVAGAIDDSETAGEPVAALAKTTLAPVDTDPVEKDPRKANHTADLGSRC